MALVAELQFTQGATVGPGGEAFIATLGGGAVTSANVNNALALSWTYQLLDVPIGSSLSTSTPYSSGSSPTGNFTPDVAGAYQVMLTVNGVGNTLATDVRTVLVETANRGWIMPAYEDTNLTLNYPNPSVPNAVGWKDSLNKIFADLDAHGFFTDVSHGATSGQALAWNGSSWVPTTVSGGGAPGGDLGGASLAVATVLKATGVGGTFAIASTAANFQWAAATVTPLLSQAATAVANATGQTLSITAQGVTGTGTTTSGALAFSSGTNTGSTTGNIGNISFTLPAPVGAGTFGKYSIAFGTSGTLTTSQLNGLSGCVLGVTSGSYFEIGTGAETLILNGNGNIGVQLTGGQVSQSYAGAWGATQYFGTTSFTDLATANCVSRLYGFTASTTASGTGATLTLAAQNNTGTTSIGGDIYLTSGSGTSTNGTTHLQVAGTDIATATTAKLSTKKGLNRALRRVATSTTLTTSDDIVIFSANGQTATLPASPAAGDKYTVGLDAANVADTYSITFGVPNNIIVQGSAVTTLTITTNATSFQAYTLVYSGSFWVACPGY